MYTSAARNLVPADTNGYADVFVWDRGSNVTSLVSVGNGPAAPVDDDGSSAPAPPTGTVVLEHYDRGEVLTAGTEVTDKRAFIRQFERPRDGDGVPWSPLLNANEWLYPAQTSAITPPDGAATGDIRAYGEQYLQLTTLSGPTGLGFANNRTYVAWLGDTPFVADHVTHADEWTVLSSGGVSAVGNQPPGAALTAPGTLQWKTDVASTWFSAHTWDQVNLRSAGIVVGVSVKVTGTFQFGSSFFVVSGTDGTYI